ncbi:MAG: CvpA family protein [Butyrivibrio sp.]|nr:CvpA family protein [Butyrivibrio sp.]
MNWTLIAVIAVILISTFIGMRKGIVKMLFSCVSVILAVVITSFAAPHIGGFVRSHTQWDEAVRDRTESYFEEKGILQGANVQIDVNELPLPVTIRDNIADSAEEYIQKGCDAYNKYIVDAAAGIIFSAIVYAAVFVLVTLILAVVSAILNLVSRLPVLKQLNRLTGAIVGALLGLLTVWLLFMLITVFGNHAFAGAVFEDINSNPVLLFLYDKNILLHLFLNLF